MANGHGHSPKWKNPNRRMAKFKNWPFTSNLAIRLFWPFVGPDRLTWARESENLKNDLHGVQVIVYNLFKLSINLRKLNLINKQQIAVQEVFNLAQTV